MTSRVIDENGFITIRNNPISRSGIFQYLASSIGADGDPDRLVNVYRPDETLSDPACIESMKLIPFIDDHTMLGKDFVPAERVGVHGTTGDDVAFRSPVLYANLKIFSETLAGLIEGAGTTDGKPKIDLSLGYRCIYEKSAGTVAGQPYEYVQRSMRGNHIALVSRARCDVSVLDHKITFDSFTLSLEQKEPDMPDAAKIETIVAKDGAPTLDSVATDVKNLVAAVNSLIAKDQAETDAAEKAAKEKAEADAKAAADKAGKTGDEPDDDDAGEDGKKAMDEFKARLKTAEDSVETMKKGGIKAVLAEIKSRDAMAERLSWHVGTFDAAEMTTQEVAEYGVKKLGLDAVAGQEVATVNGYLAAAKMVTERQAKPTGLDASGADAKDDKVAAYLAGPQKAA